MTLRSLALATLLLVGTAAPAQAGDVTLRTPVATAGAGTGNLVCTAVNRGKKTIAPLEVKLINLSGGLVANTTCVDLDPGEFCFTGQGGLVFAYCEITYSGSKKAVLGTLQVTDANDNSVLSLEAR